MRVRAHVLLLHIFNYQELLPFRVLPPMLGLGGFEVFLKFSRWRLVAHFTMLLVKRGASSDFVLIQRREHAGPFGRRESTVRLRSRQQIFNGFQPLNVDTITQVFGIGAIQFCRCAHAQRFTNISDQWVGNG